MTLEDCDVLGAEFGPGFSADRTYWRVFVQRNRWLRQEVRAWNFGSPLHNQMLCFWAKLSRSEFAALWEIVEGIGFRDFDRAYRHQTGRVTSCPIYWIKVRFPDRQKEVEAYDLHRLAEFERQPAMIGYLELWEALQRHAPFEKVPIEEGLPKPWWCFW